MKRWAAKGIVMAVAMGSSLATAPEAGAHTRSESHSAWVVNGRSVRVQFTVPELEARRLSPLGADPADSELAAYLARTVGASVGSEACAAAAAPRAVASAGGYRRVELEFRCPGAAGIELHSTAFLDRVATHTNFAQIRNGDGALVEQLFTREHPSVDLADAANGERLQSAGMLEYVWMGMLHIFTGVDHQAFLLGLVLIARRPRDLVFVVTGFTLGHSLTLALAVTGVIRPHAEYIDALVGLTIALIGAENIVANSGRAVPIALGIGALLLAMAVGSALGWGGLPTLIFLGSGMFAANYLMVAGRLRDAGRVRIIVTLLFGLIHGFGFASNLLDMRLPVGRLAQLLIGFNVGVEIAQLSVVGIALCVMQGFARLNIGLSQRQVSDVLASCLVAVGMYWFVLRSYA